jgi:spore maturation protein CgeB
VNVEDAMKYHTIYFLAAKFAYNNPDRGVSYEYQTIFLSLLDMANNEKIACYFKDVYQQSNSSDFLAEITQLSESGQNILIIYCPYTGTIAPSFLRQFKGIATTGVFFLDDTWRTDFVNSYIGSCDWFTSSDPNYKHRYRDISASNPIYFPFGYNEKEAKKYIRDWQCRDISLSFIGAHDAFRENVVKIISDAGLKIECFGDGWPNGVISNTQFYEVLGNSRMSLNLSNSANWDLRLLIKKPKYLFRNIRSSKTIEQFKARHIEIAALGACQLSYYTRGLEKILPIGSHTYIYPSIYEIPAILKSLSEKEMQRVGQTARSHVKQLSYQRQFKRLMVTQ